MDPSKFERAKSSTPNLEALTPLHLAVIKGKYAQVRWILHQRVHGVNALTAEKTTPLMLAALFGRSDIFMYLLGKKASPNLRDIHGHTALDYAEPRSDVVDKLLRRCNSFASQSPDTGRRRDIYRVLKALKASRRQTKMSYAQGRADDEARAQSQTNLQAPAIMDQADQQQPSQAPPARFVFLRSPGGKQQEFVEVRQVAAAKHGRLRRHCTGFIRGADENSSPIFAISGWGIKRNKHAARENVVGDMEYTELVREVSRLFDFELNGNDFFDQHFPGTPSEQKGAYLACHAEKKLAVYVLIKALSHVLNTEAITIENIMLLKDRINDFDLPPELRETTIHLDHELVCSNCSKFLELLTQKTGLVFRIEAHNWYIPGERTQLHMSPDGQYQPVTKATKQSASHQDADVIDDELGLFDSKHRLITSLESEPTDEEGDSVMIHSDPVTPLTTSRQSRAPRQLVPRVLSDCEKRGSPVWEAPQNRAPRYAPIVVTPPSRRAPALPTPESHSRPTEVPRITISPSPTGTSSALFPGTQSDSMSPSLSQEYEVEEIVQAKEEDGAQWYLVKWKGYPDEDSSWERANNLNNAQDAISKFWEELRETQSPNQDMDVEILGTAIPDIT